jgi:hypothetical protein
MSGSSRGNRQRASPWRRTLEQLLESGQTASEKILALVHGLIEPNTERQYLQGSVRLAKFLLEQTQGFDLAAWILEVNEDVLGAYQRRKSHFTLRRWKRPWCATNWSPLHTCIAWGWVSRGRDQRSPASDLRLLGL